MEEIGEGRAQLDDAACAQRGVDEVEVQGSGPSDAGNALDGSLRNRDGVPKSHLLTARARASSRHRKARP